MRHPGSIAASHDSRVGVTAALGWLEIDGIGRMIVRPFVVFDPVTGNVERLEAGLPGPEHRPPLVHDFGHSLMLPGLVNAHSHAFQRMIRGASQRRTAAAPSTFWDWRTAMYAAANSLDPDGLYDVTRKCFTEMLGRGITCVGEFHYLHHDPTGRTYADPNELSKQIVRAAADVGIRLVLLDVYYARAGVDRSGPLPEQRRFCDGSVDAYLRRIDDLRTAIPTLRVGITPHSVRAVRAVELGLLAAYANTNDLPIHAHVSEQPLENQQCQAEHGRSPTMVFADAGCLARAHAFTAVHAIHVSEGDRTLLADQQVCACPTTEADLGDGIVPARELLEAGTVLALGTDSNAIIDLVQEARLVEMHERLRHQTRLVLHDDEGQVAPVLLAAASRGGAQALGWNTLGRIAIDSPFDVAVFDLDHPILANVAPERALDALMASGTGGAIVQVWVGGRRRL